MSRDAISDFINEESNSQEENMTPFEKRYASLKVAKSEVRQKQSEVNRLGNELAKLQKCAGEADSSLKRAYRKVDSLKEGLSELFASEMKNY